MLSLIPIKFWFQNTHRVYTLCLNSARCVYVCVCVCMHVCVHPYLVIIQSNSDSELFNIYHPHTPTSPQLFLSEQGHVNTIAVVNHNEHMPWAYKKCSAVVFLIWVRGSSFRISSFLVKWPQPKLFENQRGFVKNGQIALAVAYSSSKDPIFQWTCVWPPAAWKKTKSPKSEGWPAIITWCELTSPLWALCFLSSKRS